MQARARVQARGKVMGMDRKDLEKDSLGSASDAVRLGIGGRIARKSVASMTRSMMTKCQ